MKFIMKPENVIPAKEIGKNGHETHFSFQKWIDNIDEY